jgi:hypothetical protein
MGLLVLQLTLWAAVGLGVVLGLLYLRGVRKPILIGTHIIVGMAALEQLAQTLANSPRGFAMGVGSFGTMAGILFAAGLPLGILAPLLGREWPLAGNIALAAHVCLGTTAFVLFLAWVAGG